MFIPNGADQGQKVTRHPFVFSPRRQSKSLCAYTLPIKSCFLPGTGRSSDLKGFDQPERRCSLASPDGASLY
jgi:hypothetical protein